MKTEFTKEEWFEVAKIAKPGITEPEYNAMWDEFVELKEAGAFRRPENH